MLKTGLARIPYSILAPLALILGLAPFRPEPHLVEKLRLLSQGLLTRPLDIFDLVLHGSPLTLLGLKLAISMVDTCRNRSSD